MEPVVRGRTAMVLMVELIMGERGAGSGNSSHAWGGRVNKWR